MAEARRSENWAHTSSLLAMLFNLNRDPKKSSAISPNALNPTLQKRAPSAAMSLREMHQSGMKL